MGWPFSVKVTLQILSPSGRGRVKHAGDGAANGLNLPIRSGGNGFWSAVEYRPDAGNLVAG